ncbi:MAG: YihY/virulence factor BrkB family protein [Tyzzerella sp.]|uniref:YihY/virulence factor BrkB family protein n=1 Tax=Candidatus Fimicola merdigallinarum TaxID=2840819 RepID=A0A9D9H0D9_9FIRM|nr:YihY/virulence factor BrkB family protein [Candidatus Fimicola merdigallinarum]
MSSAKSGENRFLFFIRELIKRYFIHRVGRSAAALAYYFVFSVFPFFIFLSMFVGYMDIQLDVVTEGLSRFVPDDVINIITGFIAYVTRERNSQIMFFGAFFSVYFPMRAVSFIVECINRAYGINKGGNMILHRLIILLVTVLFIFSILVSLVLVIVGESLLVFISNTFHFSNPYINVWNVMRFLILACLLFFVLYILYYVTPYRKFPRKYVFCGIAFSLVSWLTVSMGFSFYVENMASYSVIYGSIGAIIVLLMWLYFSSLTIIMGAEFAHTLMITDEYFDDFCD